MLIFILMAALYAVSRYLDIFYSLNGRYYGRSEANKLWRNKDADIDVTRNLIVSAATALAVLIPAGIFDPNASLILAPFTAGGFFVAWRNRSISKTNRQLQIKYLRMIREGNWPNLGWPVTRNGKTFYGLFRWVFSTKPTNGPEGTDPAVFDMQGKLLTLAESPESDWFPR